MENWLPLLVWLLVIGAGFGWQAAKRNRGRAAAQTGEDLENVRRAAAGALPDGCSPAIYAHREEQSSGGRHVTTTYYRYAVAYQGQTLYVLPLQVDKRTRQMQVGRPALFTPENLGKVTVKTKEKNGAVSRVEIWLGNKQGEAMLELRVDAENLRKNRYLPVNIMQQEECAAFERFISALAQRVSAENPGVDDLIRANDNAGLGIFGAGIAVFGAFMTLFLPDIPIGAVLGVIGLIMAIVSKARGAKGVASLIVSILCVIWSVGFYWFYLEYLFV